MKLRMVLLMLALEAPLPQSRPAGKGVVEGMVLAAGTNEPIEDVVVILAGASGEAGRSEVPSSSMMTDRQGRFAFKDLEAGAYRLALESNGYVRQEYGQRVFPGSGTTLELAKDQELRNLVVRLTRAASIRGRIVDENKQPVAGMAVELLRPSNFPNGDRGLQEYGTAQTDDHGEYRLYFITPGRYYLHAGTPQASGCCSGMKTSPNEVPDAFASTYYPGVADLQSAVPLDVKAASEIDGINWTLARQQLFHIRGRVLDAATGQPPNSVELWLKAGPSAYPVGQFGGDKGTYKNGILEFRDLVPGLYELSGSVRPSRGYLPVEVVNSDLDGLVLTVSPGGAVSGRVRIDGADSPLAAFSKDHTPSIGLGAVSGVRMPASNAPQNDLFPDGTFSIPDVLPGGYNVRLWTLQSSYYIKEAWFGGTDVLNRPLQFTGQESQTLDILLSSSAGTLNGSVTGGQGSVAGVQVVLVPDRSRHRSELFRDVRTNQDGHFSISNIVPGDYKVFAWEAIEPYSWFDPQILEQTEAKGRPVHVQELSSQNVELKMIPAEGGR